MPATDDMCHRAGRKGEHHPNSSRRLRATHRLLAYALVAASVSTFWGGASIARAEATECRVGISRETASRLFGILNHSPAEADCRFEGVETSHAKLEARWSRGGTMLPPASVVPWECASRTAQRAGRFGVQVPPEIAQSCPSVVPFIAELVRQAADEAPAGDSGSMDDPLFRAARVLFAVIVAVVLGLLVRGARRPSAVDRRWMAVGIAGFPAALALRAALPFSLGNWYSEVMPAAGPPPWMRFGPGYFAFQSLLRDAGIWGPRALIVSQLLLGAAALPLLLGVLRELQIGLPAAAATLVLLVFAPFHAR